MTERKKKGQRGQKVREGSWRDKEKEGCLQKRETDADGEEMVKRKYISETARAGVKLIKGCEGKKVAKQSNVGKTRP